MTKQLLIFIYCIREEGWVKTQVCDHIREKYSEHVEICTDASKLLDKTVGVVFGIPERSFAMNTQITDGNICDVFGRQDIVLI